jgi:SEC-C motif-containing protein
MAKEKKDASCPCGGKAYQTCCARFIEGREIPSTAEELMRSRYTAYTRNDDDYLHQTWHASTRPSEKITQEDLKWVSLEVKNHEPGGDAATVEFVARGKHGGRAFRLHEASRFVREDGRWYYVDGVFPHAKE